MAAYAATVTATNRVRDRLPGGIGVLVGECNVTNYHQTLVEITAISKAFKTVLAVVPAISDSGHVFEWVDASKSFKVWHVDNDAVADGPLIQAASDTDAGSAHFIAFGVV